MLATPLYFGSGDRAALGFLHWPEGPVHGAAVVCPPLGYEEVCAHTALRRLAEGLAGAGIVTLRIDYDGTGNSLRTTGEPGRAAAWTATIVDAIAQLREWGLPSVTLIGLRFGGTLAAAAAATSRSVSALVLWDPVISGRRYTRAMRIFSGVSGDQRTTGHAISQPTPGDGLSVAGVEFDAHTLAEMATARIAVDQLTMPCLLVVRADGESEAQPLADDAASSPTLAVRKLEGTTELLGTDAELARVPDRILREITIWTRERAAGAIEPQPAQPSCRSEVTEVHDGVVLGHRAYRVGPHGLFVVETTRADATPTGAVVTLNNGVARSIGPGGAWVEFGAMLASDGLRVLRLDLSGLGDTPVRADRVENDTYAPTAGEDVGDVIEHLRAQGVSRVALLGLCSGALVGFDATLVHPEIEVLISVNGRFDKPFHDRRADRAKRAAGQTNRLVAVPLEKTPLLAFFEKVPTWAWRWLDRAHVVASPTVAIEKTLDRGVQVFLVFGTHEWGLGALRNRGGKRFNRVTSGPRTTLVEVPSLDHSMFDLNGRAEVKVLVHEFLQDLAKDGKSPALKD